VFKNTLLGGYKGTGIAMMVEIICGVLGGAAIGKNIRNWQNTTVIANLVWSNSEICCMYIIDARRGVIP
jgi:LDH2 family malate/lactate/ureidoglycolate dehydrogenase